MLPDNQNTLSGSDVVASVPVLVAGGIKVLLDQLFPSRKSVSSAHEGRSLSQDE
jgi:hypothetical protein